jgi:hypothetical protein
MTFLAILLGSDDHTPEVKGPGAVVTMGVSFHVVDGAVRPDDLRNHLL